MEVVTHRSSTSLERTGIPTNFPTPYRGFDVSRLYKKAMEIIARIMTQA